MDFFVIVFLLLDSGRRLYIYTEIIKWNDLEGTIDVDKKHMSVDLKIYIYI